MGRAWISPVARLGFAAKGCVYVLVGVLAAQKALGLGGTATDTRGALRALGHRPFGTALLFAAGIGLLAYAVWRGVQALLDADGKGSDAKGLFLRTGFLANGLVHASLAVTALRLATHASTDRSDAVESWTARLLAEPLGEWAVGAVGVGVVVAGVYQFYKAWTAQFEERLDMRSMRVHERRWVRRIGRFGLVARGVIFGIMGWFLVQAALHADAREARGFAGSLRALRQQEHGEVLLAAIALGLVSYGLHSLAIARYRRLPG